jgi:DinB family protein
MSRIALIGYRAVETFGNIRAKRIALPYNPRYESGRAAQPLSPKNAPAHFNKNMKTRVLLFCILIFGTLQAQNYLTTAATQRYFNVVRRNLEASADVMPAEKYSFRLTGGQMTFAEWLVHATQRNYSDCAILKGEKVPEAERRAASLKEKAEVSKELKASFAYCAEALQSMDDQKAISSAEVSNALLHLVVHSNEIYGNIVGYLRVSGIVPPSTAARASQKGKK